MVEPIETISEKDKASTVIIPPILEYWKQLNVAWDDRKNISSISPSVATKGYESSKPVLENPIYKTIELYINRLEPVINRFSLFKESEIEREFDRIDQIQRDQAIKIEEAYQVKQDITFWSVLEDIGNSITSCLSFFFGCASVSAGAPVVGGALIASGVLSATNLIFKHTGLWDWAADTLSYGNESAKNAIRTYVPSAIGLTSAAFGIYGSYAAWNYTSLNGIEKGLSFVQSVTNVANVITAYGNGITQYRSKNIQADLDALRSKADLYRISLEEYTDDIQDYHERHSVIHKALSEIIKETGQAIQITQQPV